MPRPISVTIHMDALHQNLERVRETADGRDVWAVVKANAYGHGLSNAVKAFAEADGLATIDICDAAKARACGWTKRILLLEGFFEQDDIRDLEKYDIETIVHSQWMIDELKKAAPLKNVRVHIKVNSGMNRLGFIPSEVMAVRAQLEKIEGCRVMGIVTHFANAEPTYQAEGPASVRKQMMRLGKLTGLPGVCLANSAASFFHPEVGGDAIRAGVVLYGISPDKHLTSEELRIRPAMTLSARIIAVQEIAPGEAVGYGSRWIAKRPSRIGVVACGYADGYPRAMPDGAPVWVEGKRAPLTGSVSMDMLEIDITDVPEADVGSVVELWGEHINVNELADLCGTIGYELLCALAPRVPVRVDDK